MEHLEDIPEVVFVKSRVYPTQPRAFPLVECNLFLGSTMNSAIGQQRETSQEGHTAHTLINFGDLPKNFLNYLS
jgi:hypothetical protein